MPLPNPNDGEDKDKFIGRCMGNDVMNSEFPEADQRRAVCENQWTGAKFAKTGKTLDAEVFAVGEWNGMNFSTKDLNLIANAFSQLKDYHRVPIKFGHNDEQPMTDGQPALGWIESVWVKGTKLMAKFVDIPDVVYEAIGKKLYKNVSIELDMGVEHKGNYYPWVLSGVALLGADIPAVNVLADLQAYMGRGNALSFKKREFFTKNFSQENKHRRKPMSEEVVALQEEVATLKLKVTALEGENSKLVTENHDLKRTEIERRAEYKVWQDNEKARKTKEARDLLNSQLEQAVKDQKIAPFTRDDFLRDYDEAGDDDKKTVVATVEKLMKTIDSNPAYFGAQQAREKDTQRREEEELDASAIVVARTHKYMADHGEKKFTVAKQAILRADPVLAERYTKGEG